MKDTNLIIGKKNTGKTKTYLFDEVKNAIKNGDNLCVFDTRDEYFRTFSNILKTNGYNVLTLNLNEPTKSNGYNPLQAPYELYKEGKKDKAIELVNNLALEIFKSDTPNTDPFWENMAASYFTGLVLVLFRDAQEEEINLGSIQVMMNQGEAKFEDITYLKKYLNGVDATDMIYTMLSPIVFAPADTKGSIIAVCKQCLNAYMYREELLNLLNTNDVNIRNLTEKTAILIIANKTTDLVNIFIDQLVNASNMSFTYILDNLDSLRVVLSLNDLLDNATYNKNRVVAAIHNIEQFKELYGKYIIDKFENVIDLNDSMKAVGVFDDIPLGNDSDYPMLSMNKHNYVDFKKLVEEKG